MLPVEQEKVLEQIYNFVILTPSFESKSEFMRVKMFFSELHEPQISDFEATKPHSFKFGFGGEVRRVNILHSPSILSGDAFLQWLSSNMQ